MEESERIGVLLCNVRPAVTEDRRFCFELKTNRHTIVLQAETQTELLEWTAAIEAAKSKALEDPGATDTLATATRPHSDPAFSISAPPVPQFGSLVLNSTEPGASADDGTAALDRSSTLPVPQNDHLRDHSGSVDLARRSTAYTDETGQREHSSRERLMSKLDLQSKSTSLAIAHSQPFNADRRRWNRKSDCSKSWIDASWPKHPNDTNDRSREATERVHTGPSRYAT